MRSAAEATWAAENSDAGLALEDDASVKIHFTRSNADDRDHEYEAVPVDGSVELDELHTAEEPIIASGGRERPDLKNIVDEVFRYGSGEKVAVLVCGPKQMARELRMHVGSWVDKGREVFWHDESFGL